MGAADARVAAAGERVAGEVRESGAGPGWKAAQDGEEDGFGLELGAG